MIPPETPLLSIRDLRVRFETLDGPVHAVNGVNFDITAGESLAIVGESGAGKSQIAFACLGLLEENGTAQGQVIYDGQDILNVPEPALNEIRARQISQIFQDPMTSLNPYLRIGEQMAEVLVHHQGVSRRAAWHQSAQMLDAVRMTEARARLQQFPHELSGGMRQRVMIAMSLLCRPKLLIADEPTTALDVTIQAQIMALLRELQAEFGMAILLITHDLGVVAGATERVIVVYGGKIVEQGATEAVFAAPQHPYTRGLLAAVPRLDRIDDALQAIPGEPPSMRYLPEGCAFSPRCPVALEHCSGTPVPWRTQGTQGWACHLEGRV